VATCVHGVDKTEVSAAAAVKKESASGGEIVKKEPKEESSWEGDDDDTPAQPRKVLEEQIDKLGEEDEESRRLKDELRRQVCMQN
jgi:hypothetical protein